MKYVNVFNTYHKSINYNRNFSENLKIAKVVPIYKKDDQSQIKTIGLYQFYL